MSVEDPVDDGLVKFECYLNDLFGAFRARDKDKAEAALPQALHLVDAMWMSKRLSPSRETTWRLRSFSPKLRRQSGKRSSAGMSIRSHSRSHSRWTNGWPGLQRLRMLPGQRAHAKELRRRLVG
ncbi:hypothetical protein MHU86_2617 [Fragilaria crotonensis]|nr:hypothetical protein MHU86_2617 [Fragilaria crotonensis]